MAETAATTKDVTKAVIPAAGLGTRFLPATKATPKEMLPVVDKPAIQYVVEEAVAAGLDDVLMITGRSKVSIENHFDRAYELEEALMEVDPEQVSQYGCAAITPTAEEGVVTVTDLVEKPVPGAAPSNWILIGRYVCDPAVFDVLRETPPGRGGEIQLTDALLTLAKRGPADGGPVHGVLFHGRRYDTGNKLDYLRTLVQFACERSDLAEEIVPWLRKYLDSLQ